jgi:hypothetical protein
MPTKYLLPTNNSHLNQDFSCNHILTNDMAELEHLDENHQEATNRTSTRQWNITLWAQQYHKIKTFSMGGQFFGSQRARINTLKS